LGVRGGGEGWEVWSANLTKICLGLPKIFQAKETRGLLCCCYSAEGRKRGGWSRLGSLGRFAREGERIREKRRRE
jgi:hypothetical protein